MKADAQELVLGCRSWQEAHAVAEALLKAQLVTGVEFIPVKAHHSGQQTEIQLIMQGVAHTAQKIEELLKSLHRSGAPSLQVISETVQDKNSLGAVQ